MLFVATCSNSFQSVYMTWLTAVAFSNTSTAQETATSCPVVMITTEFNENETERRRNWSGRLLRWQWSFTRINATEVPLQWRQHLYTTAPRLLRQSTDFSIEVGLRQHGATVDECFGRLMLGKANIKGIPDGWCYRTLASCNRCDVLKRNFIIVPLFWFKSYSWWFWFKSKI